jgi:hypothetical protein
MSIEKDILRRSARFSRLENIEIMLLEKINIRKFVLDYIRYKKFNWYGHVWRLNRERLPEKFFWNDVHLEEKEKEDLEIRGSNK